jgi:hypothetical protein
MLGLCLAGDDPLHSPLHSRSAIWNTAFGGSDTLQGCALSDKYSANIQLKNSVINLFSNFYNFWSVAHWYC